jgi:pyruvate dehydrogenase E1 component alpha subunit
MSAEAAVASGSIVARGQNYNIPSYQIDGQNVLAVYDSVSTAAARARDGQGPTFLECITWRMRGHWEGETIELRSEEQRKLWESRDPIDRFQRALLHNRIATQEQLDQIFNGVVSEIAEAVRFAEESPYPGWEEATQDVLGGL